MKPRSWASALFVFIFAGSAFSQQIWNPKAAAAYLDERAAWWIAWPAAARDQGTVCVSCHTLGPYALSRSMLRSALSETGPSEPEKKTLASIVRRVRMWNEVEPFYPDSRGPSKGAESRGTEAIFNALILVWNDAPSGRLSPDARLALENMWTLQTVSGESSGSWPWLEFHNAPWEGGSQFYGTALAALAVGSAPGNYQSDPAARTGIGLLRSWLRKNMDAQTCGDRLVLLWASTKLAGLLNPQDQQSIAGEILAKQRDDGGFSMASMIGGWKRRDNTPLDHNSDAYATGLAALALAHAPGPNVQPALRRALAWLNRNQNPIDGRWSASSLNKQRELSSDAGLFMSDAATAYAVMALVSSR
jgi:hypothetical protein